MNEGIRYCITVMIAASIGLALGSLGSLVASGLWIAPVTVVTMLAAWFAGAAISRTLLHGGDNGDV